MIIELPNSGATLVASRLVTVVSVIAAAIHVVVVVGVVPISPRVQR
jgi:hypothetical protein